MNTPLHQRYVKSAFKQRKKVHPQTHKHTLSPKTLPNWQNILHSHTHTQTNETTHKKNTQNKESHTSIQTYTQLN